MLLQGTLVNCVAICVGSLLGFLLGRRFSPRLKSIATQALGMSVLFIGINIGLQNQEPLVLLGSMILGGMTGELLNIERNLARFESKVEARFSKKYSNLLSAFVTASMVFGIGSLAILGAIEEGLKGDASILYAKSFLDGVTSMIFASSMGIGVIFSALTVFLYQAPITIFAEFFGGFFSDYMIANLSSVGGVLIAAIGLNVLGVTTVRVSNLLPAIFYAILLSFF